jgi:hypothetical protein
LDNDLKNCNNLKEVLIVVEKYYDLRQPFGIATKILIINGIKKILQMIKAVKKAM